MELRSHKTCLRALACLRSGEKIREMLFRILFASLWYDKVSKQKRADYKDIY